MKGSDIKLTIERNYKFIDEGYEKEYLARLLATNIREIEEGIIKKWLYSDCLVNYSNHLF